MLAAGTTLGPYEIVALLGAGGMGEVYRAHDPRLGRDVAIKVLSPHLAATPDARARFEREARTISQLNHPHICTLFDVGHQDGTDYLVMELLDGETLAHRLEKGPLQVPEVLALGTQIADALDRAHWAGVVHRDLKPGNVMLTRTGAKLMDFGLARAPGLGAAPGVLTESPTVSRPLTVEGTILGTFQYLAPEQLEGREADARSDLWGLGCVLYEMATGRRAFEGASQASLIAAILKETPRPILDLRPVTPPALGRIVEHCLEKSPDDRFQSARDLAFDLDGLRRAMEGAAPGAGKARESGRPRWKSRAASIVALLLALALAAAGAFLAGRRADDRTRASQMTYTRLTGERGRVFSARFSPDGGTIFYSAAWNGQPVAVFEARPGLPTSRALGLPQTELLSISRSGMMAVTLGHTGYTGFYPTYGTLAEVPLSAGAPHRLLEDVLSGDWSPDGRTLAISHRVAGRARLEMPPRHVLFETSGGLTFVRVAPSGRWLAFAENPVPPDNRGRIVIVDTTGRVLARSAEWSGVTGVAWSRDGREVWFGASESGAMTEIRALRPDGSQRVVERFPGWVALHDIGHDGQVLLTRMSHHHGLYGRRSPTEEEQPLGWMDVSTARDISSDGQMLLIDAASVVGGPLYAACLRGMDGSPPVRLGEGLGCALSPDGRWVLAIHFGPPHRLLLLPTGAGDSTSLPRGAIETYQDARWLPDGKAVAFVGSEAGRARRTYVQDVQGGPPRPVTPDEVTGTFVSPDGRFVAAVSRDQRLYAHPIGGGEPQLLGQLLAEEIVLQWAPDGRSIYVGQQGTRMSVTRLERDTGRRVPWRTFSAADPAGVQIYSAVLTPDGRSYAYTYCCVLDDLYLVTGLK